MDEKKTVRRSGRQTSERKFFVPHFDPSYAIPAVESKPEVTDSEIMSESDSDKLTTKRRPKLNSTDSGKKRKKSTPDSDLLSDDVVDHNGQENMSLHANKMIPGGSQSSSQKKQKVSATKKASSAKKPKDGPTGPKRRKTKFESINEKLKAIGINPSGSNGNCARSAIYKGHIKLTGNRSDLQQIILSGTLECGHKCDATLGDLLQQPDYAGLDYEDGAQESPVVCDETKDEGRCGYHTYVTRICSGKPEFDSGKFHNHCTRCNGFGKCIGDYREAHCTGCNRHYFAGSGGQFGCDRCGGDSDSEGRDDCVLM